MKKHGYWLREEGKSVQTFSNVLTMCDRLCRLLDEKIRDNPWHSHEMVVGGGSYDDEKLGSDDSGAGDAG